MAKGMCPKCNERPVVPNRAYCKECGNEWQNEWKKTHPQIRTEEQKERQLQRARERHAERSPEEKRAYWAKKEASRQKWLAANPDMLVRINERARKKRETWTPERLAQQKATQKAHYERCLLRPIQGLCGYSVNCSEPPIGKQKFCLRHWCKSLRHADLRLKAEYTVSELVDLWNKQEGKCAVTGIALIAGETASIDHIVPVADGREGLGCISNMRFVHGIVNRMKWDLSDGDFKAAIVDICPKMIEWAKNNS